MADSQTWSKPLINPQIALKIALFDLNFTFLSPKSHKNPGLGGWVNTFGRDFPKIISLVIRGWMLKQPIRRRRRRRRRGGGEGGGGYLLLAFQAALNCSALLTTLPTVLPFFLTVFDPQFVYCLQITFSCRII